MRFLLIGERPSPTARNKGWTWRDERLCAATLAAALEACGVQRRDYHIMNLFEEDGQASAYTLSWCRAAILKGWQVVGMGQKVQAALTTAEVPHLAMIHPAARGKIRKRELYQAHVREVLLSLK